MKNWQRFTSFQEADAAIKAEGVLMVAAWAELSWLYLDYFPNEPRVEYLRRLKAAGILKATGYAELQKLEKLAGKAVQEDADARKGANNVK